LEEAILMCNPDPDAHCQEVTPETFAELRARYRGYVDSQDVQNLVYVETWIRDMVSCGATENECYRMFGEAFDDDLLGGAKLLAAKWTKGPQPASRNIARYMLRFCQRVLFANYAFAHVLCMERLLWRAGDGWANVLWRVFAAYSLPRLWASVLIGMAAVTGSSAMQTGLQRLSAPENHFWFWLCLLLLAAFLLGMLNVERRVGRRWKEVLCRSLVFVAAGVAYSGAIGLGWTFVLAKYLEPAWPYDGRYACLSAATALGMAHIVQLFWHEASTAEPM
jgi:hypothetical protein